MKSCVITILWIVLALLPAPVCGEIVIVVGQPATAPPTYLRSQGFEGTGYDNSETWTTSTGSPDADYTGVVLAGSQSLQLSLTGAAERVRSDFTSNTEVWFYCLLHLVGSAPAGNRTVMSFATGSSEHSGLTVTSASKLRIECGTANATTTDALSYGTTYSVWVHYKKGTGSNAEMDVEFSTTTTKTGSGNKFASLTTGTSTSNADRVYLGYTSTATFDEIFDYLRIDDAAIGSAPQ